MYLQTSYEICATASLAFLNFFFFLFVFKLSRIIFIIRHTSPYLCSPSCSSPSYQSILPTSSFASTFMPNIHNICIVCVCVYDFMYIWVYVFIQNLVTTHEGNHTVYNLGLSETDLIHLLWLSPVISTVLQILDLYCICTHIHHVHMSYTHTHKHHIPCLCWFDLNFQPCWGQDMFPEVLTGSFLVNTS